MIFGRQEEGGALVILGKEHLSQIQMETDGYTLLDSYVFHFILRGSIFRNFPPPWSSRCQNDWLEVNLQTKLGEGRQEGVGMFLNIENISS